MDVHLNYVLQLEGVIKQYRKFEQSEFAKRSIEITSDQWMILECVARNEEIAQKDIAMLTFKDPASVTRIIDILVHRSFLERKSDKNDRRAVNIQATKKGMHFFEEVMPLVEEMREFGLRKIAKNDLNVLFESLGQMKSNFE